MNQKPVRLLIVEDESIAALFLSKVFTHLGFEVVKTVATGADAIKTTMENKPDGILMDINLIGRMNGIEAAQKILVTTKVPIVFATGYDDDENRQSAAKLNCAGYYVKPLSIETLAEIGEIFKQNLPG